MKIAYRPGLDIGRLIAAFGVLTVHLGPKEPQIDQLLLALSAYRIPFFLLASSFLFAGKVHDRATASFWKKGYLNLLIPYLIWTLIYVGFRIFKHIGDSAYLAELLANPLEILFCGNAAIHLYYIPLLLLELCALTAIGIILRSRLQSLTLLIGLFLLSTIPSGRFPYIPGISHIYVINSSGGLLAQLANIANFSLQGILLILPYAFGGLILRHPAVQKALRSRSEITFLTNLFIFILVNTLYINWGLRVPFLQNVILAGSFLLIAVYIPMPEMDGRSQQVRLFLRSYYGIYLVHHLILEGLEWANNKLGILELSTYNWTETLLVASIGFTLSFAVVIIIKRSTRLGPYLVGS